MKYFSFVSKPPYYFLWLLLLQVFVSCNKEYKNDLLPEQPMIPVVMAHGLIGSGDAYELQLLRFASNGYPLGLLHTFEWNTLDPDFSGHVDALDVFIDEVLAATGFDQVDLVGHSYGTRLSMSYCSRTDRAIKVRNVVLMGGSAQTGPAGNAEIKVPTLNIWSPFDRIVSTGGETPGATNLRLKQKDHFEVASCRNPLKLCISSSGTGSLPLQRYFQWEMRSYPGRWFPSLKTFQATALH